jgi:hypothetical protein
MGTVSEIDQPRGLVTVAGAVGTVKLHFPPQSLRDIQKGDVITARYAFAEPSGQSMRAYDAPHGRDEHKMAGTVVGVDHVTGLVDVKTDEAPLQLIFRPQAIRDLKQGDAIVVEMAFSKGA